MVYPAVGDSVIVTFGIRAGLKGRVRSFQYIGISYVIEFNDGSLALLYLNQFDVLA